jgi:PKD domain
MAAAAALPTPATAYRIDRHVIPQPTILYFVALHDWKKPFDRAVRAVNRAHVGVQLRKAKIPEQATIQVGRLEHRCGYPGMQGTTQSISGGYAAIYLPRGCHGTIASIIAAHELGHALGLRHDNRHCALLNSSGSGPDAIPTHCHGRRYDWLNHPFRADDLRGLRRLYRNTAPKARLTLTHPGTQTAGRSVRFGIEASDRERNISELRLDFGDGTVATGFKASELPRSHVYTRPGKYRATLDVVDYYSRHGRSRVTVTVAAAP